MTYQPPYPPAQPPQPPQGPYPTFDYYYQQQPDFLAPARRAAVMLFVLGAISIIGSFCCIGATFSVDRLMQIPEFSSKLQEVPGFTPEMFRAVALVGGVLSLGFGVTYIVLGVLVRRGSKGAAITAMVLTILATLLLLLQIIGPIVTGQARGEQALGVCVMMIPLMMMILLIVWLAGAMRATEQLAAQRYAMDYWRYAQQQQGLQQMPPMPPGGPPASAGGPPPPRDRPPQP